MILFRFISGDAWGQKSRSIEVHDKLGDNVICSIGSIMNSEEERYSLDEASINEIKNLIKANKNLSKIDFLENAPMLDGDINTFEIAFDEAVIEIQGKNLWYFAETDPESFDKSSEFYPKKALEFLNFYKEIAKIFWDNAIDKKYYTL